MNEVCSSVVTVSKSGINQGGTRSQSASLKRESCISWHLIYLYSSENLDFQMFLGNTNVLREVEAVRAFLFVKFLYMSAYMGGSLCVNERLFIPVIFGLMLTFQ